MKPGYTPPSKCESCVPVETELGLTLRGRITELSHQFECPNHPEATQ